MIRNPDGTPYRASGEYKHFNPTQPEHCLFNSLDQEAIEIGGSPIYYYEALLQQSTIDPLYLEDRGKLYSIHPITLYATYEPITAGNTISVFGIDAPDEMKFELNYRAVLKKLGHPPKLDSRIYTPHKGEDWRIIHRQVGEFKMWGEIRLILICKRFQESVTTGEGRVTEPKPPRIHIN